MEIRNDPSALVEAGIPVELTKFSCGCWGRHAPPSINDNGVIEIAVGQGYRSNKHLHGQNLYILGTDAENCIALIEMRKYGDLYGAGMWHYLVGVEGAPFIAQTPNTIGTLTESLEYLKPAEVKRAEAKGLEVLRQGDWYFVPVARAPRGEVETEIALDDDHRADEAVIGKTVAYARGRVTHGQHHTVVLEGWHKAIRNRAIRTGRLTRGGGVD